MHAYIIIPVFGQRMEISQKMFCTMSLLLITGLMQGQSEQSGSAVRVKFSSWVESVENRWKNRQRLVGKEEGVLVKLCDVQCKNSVCHLCNHPIKVQENLLLVSLKGFTQYLSKVSAGSSAAHE